MTVQPIKNEAEPELPLARVREASSWRSKYRILLSTRMWVLTAFCGVVALGLVGTTLFQQRPVIVVTFENGHGIKPGDVLRFRGVEIGEVVSVLLHTDLDRLDVSIELESHAESIARRGSEFWIERPQLSLSRLRGLDTLVGANYVGVKPGHRDGPRQTEFTGLEAPPALNAAEAPEIVVRFRTGQGLAVGDVVKYRGIDVGEVTAVTLSKDLSGVAIKVRLITSASALARQGTLFWVERPRITMTGVRGLDTVVGGKFLAVLPGATGAQPRTVFDGLEAPPAMPERSAGGLEITIESDTREGLTVGAPIKFRGMEVGKILGVGLSSDAVRVESRAYVLPDFRQLIRDNTRFWAVSGMDVQLGIGGFRMDVDSLSTLAGGGVALITPEPAGQPVATGHRFSLGKAPEEDELQQQARIPLGSSLLPNNLPLPQPAMATLEWRRNGWLKTQQQKEGWVVLLEGGRLLVLTGMLLPEAALDKQPLNLSLLGKKLKVDASRFKNAAPYSVLELPRSWMKEIRGFPRSRVRIPQQPEDCLLVADPLKHPLPLASGRLSTSESGWRIDPAVALEPDWKGAAVVSRLDGALIGSLWIEQEQHFVVPLSGQALVLLGTPSD